MGSSTAIVRTQRADLVTVRFVVGSTSGRLAAELARRMGLLRAELKLQRRVLVRPHVRRWPGKAS